MTLVGQTSERNPRLHSKQTFFLFGKSQYHIEVLDRLPNYFISIELVFACLGAILSLPTKEANHRLFSISS